MPAWQIESPVYKNITCVIIIPAIAEFENIKTLLSSLAENDPLFFERTLILFVINNLHSSKPEIIIENQKTIKYLKNIKSSEGVDELSLKIISSKLQVDYVDASSAGKELPDKDGGVGLARKIGMDLALRLFDYKSSEKKILVCLDADCTVDNNYLTEIHRAYNLRNLHAARLNFCHSLNGSNEENLAIICYELFILYYVLGLKYANSNYAFPTVGSLITCDYKSYINIEGMNKRKAGEDFYFMEKLAKNFIIEKITSTTVYPSGRTSWRVPFGTGQRVGRFLSKIRNEYLVYDPGSFVILKKWLEVFNEPSVRSANEYLEKAGRIHKTLNDFLVEQNFAQSWEHIIKNHTNPVTLQKQKIMWFDGFRTMKLIHFLRDHGFPLKPMFGAIEEILELMNLPFIKEPNRTQPPSIEIQKKYLDMLRKVI